MIHIIRTNAENRDFIELVRCLDAALARQDGDEHAFYDQFNKIDSLRLVILAYEDKQPVGCGAIKEFGPDTMEIKRMYVRPENRGKGIASMILEALEQWTAELGKVKCVLETGTRQGDAVRLYTRRGYRRIPNYGQYEGIGNSLCFEKIITVSNS